MLHVQPFQCNTLDRRLTVPLSFTRLTKRVPSALPFSLPNDLPFPQLTYTSGHRLGIFEAGKFSVSLSSPRCLLLVCMFSGTNIVTACTYCRVCKGSKNDVQLAEYSPGVLGVLDMFRATGCRASERRQCV
jgi:hypothetical protein